VSKVVVIQHLTLDGVMQAPGHPDEDPRDGFEHGGWAQRGNDPVMQNVMGARMGASWSLLLGRTTYERFADFWPKQKPNPFTEALNKVRKYVASTTLTEPLPWTNSTLLKGDAAEAVAALKEQQEDNLVVFGSGGAGPVADATRPRRRVRDTTPPAGAGIGAPPVPPCRPVRHLPVGRLSNDDHRRDHRDIPASPAYQIIRRWRGVPRPADTPASVTETCAYLRSEARRRPSLAAEQLGRRLPPSFAACPSVSSSAGVGFRPRPPCCRRTGRRGGNRRYDVGRQVPGMHEQHPVHPPDLTMGCGARDR
jgi:dihydrofolate reductase